MFGEQLLWHSSSDVVGTQVLCETLKSARILVQASVWRAAAVPGTGLDAVKRTGTKDRCALRAKGGSASLEQALRSQMDFFIAAKGSYVLAACLQQAAYIFADLSREPGRRLRHGRCAACRTSDTFDSVDCGFGGSFLAAI